VTYRLSFLEAWAPTPTMWYIGAILSLLGSACSNFGVNIQKLSFMKNDKKPEALQKVYYKDSLWWLGMVTVVFGSIGDFVALSFTGQAIVAQIGATTLVANIFFARVWLKESVSKWDVAGCALIVIGPGLSVGFGNHNETSYSINDLRSFFVRPLFIVYATLLFISGVSVYYFIKKVEPIRAKLDSSRKAWDDRANPPPSPQLEEEEVAALWTDVRASLSNYNKYARFHGLSYLALSGMFGANSILFGKSVSELLKVSVSGNNQFTHVLTYVFLACMFCCIFSQLHFLALALKLFDAMYCVPVFQCFFISLSTIAGGCYFYEFNDFSPVQWFMFSLGLVITLIGVYMMSFRVQAPAAIDSVRPGHPSALGVSKKISRMELELEELELELEMEKSTLSINEKYTENNLSVSQSNNKWHDRDDLEDSKADQSPLRRHHSIDINPSPGQTPSHSPKISNAEDQSQLPEKLKSRSRTKPKNKSKKNSKKESKTKHAKQNPSPVLAMLKISHANKHHHLPSDEDDDNDDVMDGRLRIDAPSAAGSSPFSSPESSDAQEDRGSATKLMAKKQSYRRQNNIGVEHEERDDDFEVPSPVVETLDGDFVLVHRKPNEQKAAESPPKAKRSRRLVPIPKGKVLRL